MLPAINFERHTPIRARIKAFINQLKSEGVTAAELIEACRRELQLLHIERLSQLENQRRSFDPTRRWLIPLQSH